MNSSDDLVHVAIIVAVCKPEYIAVVVAISLTVCIAVCEPEYVSDVIAFGITVCKPEHIAFSEPECIAVCAAQVIRSYGQC